eukprot:3298208-Rhodomonas_salina.2
MLCLAHSPVDVDDVLLSDAMCTVHGLEVAHRVPVVLDEDDGVGARQVEPQPPDVRGQEQHVDGRVAVELLLHLEAPRVRRPAVHAQVRHRRHARAEQILFDDVQHHLHLAEDQHSVLRPGPPPVRPEPVRPGHGLALHADPAVPEQLSQRHELRRQRHVLVATTTHAQTKDPA